VVAVVLMTHLCFLFQSWLKAYSQSRHAGQAFATENFLSWRTLVTLADIKRQFLELLASIGFVPVEIGPRRGGNDNILNITGPEVSETHPIL
jgi:ATP-dependent RNA helicase DHX57